MGTAKLTPQGSGASCAIASLSLPSRFAPNGRHSARVVRCAREGISVHGRLHSSRRRFLKNWIRAIRAHQWSKNVLVLVPLLTSFSFTNPRSVSRSIIAFVAFSAIASANYLVNDVIDLKHDRAHPTKQKRPIASGAISLRSAAVVASFLYMAGAAAALTLGIGFTFAVDAYLALAIAYTFQLKKIVMIDVVTLAFLYTIRIIAGAAAIGTPLSSWLLAFSVFLFLSLALIKRCAELLMLESQGISDTAAGRGYRVSDLRVLWPLGMGAALCSVVIFGLFVSAPETQSRYASPKIVWLAGIGLIYWLGRLWIKTSRGEMHEDPIVFTATDAVSVLTITLMVAAAVIGYTASF